MTHHWRASDGLEQSFSPGQWRLYDRGTVIGHIHQGLVNGREAFRGISPAGQVLGYASTLEQACDRLWEWHQRRRAG